VDRRRGRRGARRGRRLAHLGVGDKVRTQGAVWTVTGLFDSNGDAHESELITDNKTLAGAMRRLDDVQTVTVMLDSPSALTTFKQALTSNPTLAVDVVAERDYFAQQSRGVTTLLCGPSGCPG
jgi:putative ABC transport system permease protein